jgi:hypothetical protein
MRTLKPGLFIISDQGHYHAHEHLGLPDDISVGDGWKVGVTRSGDEVTLLRIEGSRRQVKQTKHLTGEIAAAIHAAAEVGADLTVINIVRRYLGLPEVDQEPPRVPGPTAYCATLCPYCEGYCECEEIDNGVGHQQVTPYVCGVCGAEQIGPYDLEDTRRTADAEELHNRWWKGHWKGHEKEQPQGETTVEELE